MVKFICDMCEKEEIVPTHDAQAAKPLKWLVRPTPKGEEHVCSIECAIALNEKTNTESLIS